jgi:hypothetical protein
LKNIQVIDGADNCAYDIFSMSDASFRLMFPDGRDIEFIDDFIERVGQKKAGSILNSVWKRRMDKKSVVGIHGTLFYELDHKKRFYPTKKSAELIT